MKRIKEYTLCDHRYEDDAFLTKFQRSPASIAVYVGVKCSKQISVVTIPKEPVRYKLDVEGKMMPFIITSSEDLTLQDTVKDCIIYHVITGYLEDITW